MTSDASSARNGRRRLGREDLTPWPVLFRRYSPVLWAGLSVSALGIVLSVIDATATDVRTHGLRSVMLWAVVTGIAGVTVLGAIGLRTWRTRRKSVEVAGRG